VYEPFFKSNAHHAALARNLTAAGYAHAQADAPANPQRVISASAHDELLSPTERVRAPKERARTATSGAQRSGVDDAGDTDEEEERGPDGMPLSKSLSRGVLRRLQAVINEHDARQHYAGCNHQTLSKSQGASTMSHADTEEVTSMFSELMARPKVQHVALTKSLAPAFDKIKKNLAAVTRSGKTLAKAMKSTTTATPTVYDPAAVALACQTKLAQGELSPEAACKIETELGLSGRISTESAAALGITKVSTAKAPTVDGCKEALAKGLASGELTKAQAMAGEAFLNRLAANGAAPLAKSQRHGLPTNTQCFEALTKSFAAGQISAAQAMTGETCLIHDQPIPADTMKIISQHF
jgi:hypothetical protein